MTAVLRFVDSIQATPVIRLNLNDGAVWVTNADTSFGSPAMRRSVAASMLRDGDHVGASAYGNREIVLVLRLHVSGDAAATQVQLLQRELDRPMKRFYKSSGEQLLQHLDD
jgi:hypothetical protein